MGREEYEKFDLETVGRRLRSEFGTERQNMPDEIARMLEQLKDTEKRQRDKRQLLAALQ
jgi:hypothetical protein